MSTSFKILIGVSVCLAVGFLSGYATQSSVSSWFLTLEKPSFNPPSWVFGPVWTMLYILMGVAAGWVWGCYSQYPETVKRALLFFGIQLALNALWSVLFFGMRNPLLALVDIVILLFLIFETFLQFRRINPNASYLLLPYFAWVLFATVLNASIWWLNR
jgi:translocator protein